MKKNKTVPIPDPPMKDLTDSTVKFCLNCDDMDDLAVSLDETDLDDVKARFRNCNETGRFQGDVCSRMFVATDVEDTALFENESNE
jgi:hypothetical protein